MHGYDVRRFYLNRLEDETGISGTGVVAWGACFRDRLCVMVWVTKTGSIAIYASPEELLRIHGHDGKTELVWVD